MKGADDKRPRPGPGGRRKRLGDHLVEAGLIDEAALRQALEVQKVRYKRLGEILRDDGLVDDEAIARALGRMFRAPIARLEDARVAREVLDLVPAKLARVHRLVPIKRTPEGLFVATANPSFFHEVEKDLHFVTQMPVRLVVTPEGELGRAIERFYPDRTSAAPDEPSKVEFKEIELVQQETDEDVEDVEKLAGAPPVVRFINGLFAEAVMTGASDIHIEPRRDDIEVRFRVDGILRPVMRTNKMLQLSIVSRAKVIADLDISIRREPQDGKARIRYGGRVYDLRVSTLPAYYGEKVTIRILNPAQARLNPEDLGFSPPDLARIGQALFQPKGLILVTGPTGSGKTSTLYAFINRRNTKEVNIITVEDPVEYDVEGLTQVQINPKGGVTFASALRSILRQDPDIVMVGEIRDGETARTAVEAAQTGHLVLSTLHTNDAPSAVIRLLDLGVEPPLVADALIAAVGQRLVRKICESCKTENVPAEEVLDRVRPHLGGAQPVFFRGVGCEQCDHSGYRGRLGIFELLHVNPGIREAIGPNIPPETLRRIAERDGFKTLFQDGLEKALAGLTTIEEVLRVAPPGEAPIQKPDSPGGLEVSSPGTTEASGPATTPSRDTWEVDKTPALFEPEEEIFTRRGPIVLVVDDNEEVLAVLKRTLEGEGAVVHLARNGAEGLDAAHRLHPDVIVTDYKMPVMDGFTLIRLLKGEDRFRNIPVIMLTARDEVESEVKVLEAGADDYLVKPVDRRKFLARMKRFLVTPL